MKSIVNCEKLYYNGKNWKRFPLSRVIFYRKEGKICMNSTWEGASGKNQEIEQLIRDYVKNYQVLHQTETSWGEPLVGFADAEDAMFYNLPKIIGPECTFPDDVMPDAKSVIVYFIPFTEELVENHAEELESFGEWDFANIEADHLLVNLNQYLQEIFERKGYRAAVLPPTYQYDEEELVSNWSHKSVAYIAGLGKFGVHQLLITESGCCGRFGSIVTDLELVPSERPEEEFCLYRYDGSCEECMKRCAAKAFCRQGYEIYYDRQKCNDYIYNGGFPKYLDGAGDSCGKCMYEVPCSFENPVRKKKQERKSQ